MVVFIEILLLVILVRFIFILWKERQRKNMPTVFKTQPQSYAPEHHKEQPSKHIDEKQIEPKGDDDYFREAFEKLLLDIDGDKEVFRTHVDLLINTITTGNWIQGRVLMASLIPEYSWRWPAYEGQILRREKEKHLDYIGRLRDEPCEKILERIKLSELRQLADGRVKAKSKKELIAALKLGIPSQEFDSICTATRQRIIAEAASFQPRYEDRCHIFIRRLSSLIYGMKNKAHLRDASSRIPGIEAEFRIGDPFYTPQECLSRNGMVVSADDPVIETMCPCERLECSCLWLPWNEAWNKFPKQ